MCPTLEHDSSTTSCAVSMNTDNSHQGQSHESGGGWGELGFLIEAKRENSMLL